MQCPRCGGVHIQKKGIRAGKQRYLCCDCEACFTEGVEYVRQKKFRPVRNVKCPICGSEHIRRDGKTGGYQRYECCDCKKNFSEYTFLHPKTKIEYKCPYCGGELRYGGYGRKGQREYYCKECHKSCTANENGEPIIRHNFSEINKSVRCPECDSLNIKKAGSTKGNKRFKCKDCGRLFLGNVNKRYTKSKKKEAISSVLKGLNIKEAAVQFDYTSDYLVKLIKESRYEDAIRDVLNGMSERKAAIKNSVNIERLQKLLKKEYAEEIISREQKENIIKYGVHLSVPVDYMAEYIHCSEHKCEEIIRKYKERVMTKL